MMREVSCRASFRRPSYRVGGRGRCAKFGESLITLKDVPYEIPSLLTEAFRFGLPDVRALCVRFLLGSQGGHFGL